MKTIDRYIIAHITGLSLIVALALMSVYTLIQFVSEMDSAGQGRYGYGEIFLYILLSAPTGLYILLPLIAMLGTLLGLGTLAGSSELIAMRAAGVSLMRVGGATAVAGVAAGLLCLLLSDWLAPAGRQMAEALRTEARTGVRPGITGNPVWLRDGAHIFHIRRLIAEDQIAAVEVFTLGEGLQLQSMMTVREARYENGHWRMRGVNRTAFTPDSAQVTTLQELVWEGSLSPDVLRLFVLESRALSIRGLARLISYLRENKLDSADYELALGRKLTAPFTVIVMMLFAVPFVLGPLRGAGTGQRLLVGIVIGLVFYVLNEVSANTGQIFRWNPLVAAGAPTLLFAGVALWRLSRAR